MKKVGIMGGTFNPIHIGHLFLAENSYEQLGLEKILFMPSKNPPHKAAPHEVTQEQRVEMITLAIRNNPHFELSTLELEREGITYTADTLTQLTKAHADTEYYFIVGADSLLNLQKWKEPQTIFNLCTIVAANRDNEERERLIEQIEYLRKIYCASIILIDMPTIQVASAVVRERIAAGKSVRYYLPDAVNDYIIRNSLYTTEPEDIQ